MDRLLTTIAAVTDDRPRGARSESRVATIALYTALACTPVGAHGPSSTSIGAEAAFVLGSYVAAARVLAPECEKVSASQGRAIRRALTDFERNHAALAAYVATEPYHLRAMKYLAAQRDADPAWLAQMERQPGLSCTELPQTLRKMVAAVVEQTRHVDFAKLPRLYERERVYLVPPDDRRERVQDDVTSCLVASRTSAGRLQADRALLAGRLTDSFFLPDHQPRLTIHGFPYGEAGIATDRSTPQTDGYVICLLKLGYQARASV